MCDAVKVTAVIGKAATAELIEAARVAAGARVARTLRPGQIVTMEYRADRLSLSVDRDDIVREVRCG